MNSKGNAYWIQYRKGSQLPEDAVVCCRTKFKKPVFVARTWTKGQYVPGFALNGVGYFEFRCQVLQTNSFEVLCGNCSFRSPLEIQPHELIAAGINHNKEPTYVGAFLVSGLLLCGQVRRGICSVAFNGEVITEESDFFLLASK